MLTLIGVSSEAQVCIAIGTAFSLMNVSSKFEATLLFPLLAFGFPNINEREDPLKREDPTIHDLITHFQLWLLQQQEFSSPRAKAS